MIAPSEKHLEDWIVANYDKIMPEFWGYDEHPTPFISRIIRRQPPFPHGRPDLIFESRFAVCVLELKKGAIDSNTVTQVYRYLFDLSRIAFTRHLYATDCYQNELKRVHHPEINNGIYGFVMGHSIESVNLQIACKAMGIMPILYDFDGTNYQFDVPHLEFRPLDETIKDWADGALGDAVWSAMTRFTEWDAQT